MGRKLEYIRFPGDVKVTKEADQRGYHRVRWPNRDGTRGDRRFNSFTEAEAFAWELSGAIRSDRGGAPRLGDRPIAELVEAWHDDRSHDKPLAPGYKRSVGCWQNKYVIPVIGHLRAANWEPEHTRKVLATARDNGLSGGSLARLRRDLGSLVAVGKRLGYLAPTADPLAGVAVARSSRELDLTSLPTVLDVKRIAAHAASIRDEWWRSTQIELLALTGLRIGEALGLSHDDVDLEGRRIHVRRQLLAPPGPITMSLPKYGSTRTVPIGAMTIRELDRLLHENRKLPAVPFHGHGELGDGELTPLFPSYAGTWERYSTWKNGVWAPAANAAGWARGPGGRGFVWSPHTLRHFFCTMALAPKPDGLGLEVADVSRVAGHSSPEFTYRVYVQSRPGRIDRGADALDELEW